MRKKLAAAAVGASLLVGGGAGAMLMAPVTATAADESTSNSTGSDGTQSDGTTNGSSTAPADGQCGPGGPMGRGGGPGLSVAAEAIGIEESALRTALQDGQTIAEVAAANNVDVQKVIDAIVADMNSHLDEAVSAGRLTQEQADERKADAEERATALVNGELPAGGPGGPGGPPPGAPGSGDGSTESGADTSTSSTA